MQLIRNKKTAWLFVVFLCIFCSLLLLFVQDRVNRDNNSPIQELTKKFYEFFIVKDYAAIAEQMVNQNPQQVIHTRHWFGEVSSFEVKSIRSIAKGRKKVTVEVTTTRNGQEEKVRDYLEFAFVDGKWLIASYNSELEYNLP